MRPECYGESEKGLFDHSIKIATSKLKTNELILHTICYLWNSLPWDVCIVNTCINFKED